MKTKTEKIGSRLRKPRHLPEEVASILRDEIEKGTFKTGERLPAEMTLAKEFDVSRTVIREALARLKYDGLLDTRQGRGASVTNITMRNAFRLEAIGEISKGKFEHFMELRVIVESDTASLAALRCEDSHVQRLKACLELMDDAVLNTRDGSDADLEFHKEIAKAYRIDKIPATVIEGDIDYGIRYYGIPAGYEFAALLDTIIEVSKRDSGLAENIRQKLKEINLPVHIQVFVTPT